MSLDIDKINGLLKIVKEAAGHPTKLRSLGALAMRELEAHDAEAKKEHDGLLAKDAAEAARVKADATAKAKKLADEEAKKAELTSKPQVPVRPSVPAARADDEFEPETDDQPIRRREVPEEVNHGA